MDISVVMPVYGVEKYIEKSVDSICNQDFKNFELILVNDGTKDNSIDKAEKSIRGRCKYKIASKENGGLPSARNFGLQMATGKYVCFIDSDDVISPNHLSSLYKLCETNGLNISFAGFEETELSNRDGASTSKEDGYSFVYDNDTLMRLFLERSVKVHCCAILVKVEYLKKNEFLFNEELKYGEDIDFMWRIFPRVSQIGYSGLHSYKYLQRQQSLVSQQYIDRVINLINIFYDTIKKNREEFPEKEYIWKYLGGRAYLSFCKSFAKSSTYSKFNELVVTTNYKKHLVVLKDFPNAKARYFSKLLFLSKFLFFCVSKFI